MPLNTDALGAGKPSLFDVRTACADRTCEAGLMQLEDGWNEPTAFLPDQGMLTNKQILSVILSAAVQSSNAQAAAGSLLQRYGTLNAVLTAPGRALATTSGVGPAGAALLKAVHGPMLGTLENEVTGHPVLSCWDDLMNYVRAIFDGERVEAFHVLFFGQDNALIADEKMARGTVDCVAIYPREVVRRALELNATAVILVHNHPGGASNASRQNIQLTANLVKALGYRVSVSSTLSSWAAPTAQAFGYKVCLRAWRTISRFPTGL